MDGGAIREMLDSPLTASLSTLDPDGFPHVAAMWFVVLGDEICLATYATSQKARNLQRDARCAFHVEDGETYSTLRGVLVRSTARLSSDPEAVLGVMLGVYERYRRPRQGPITDRVREEMKRQARRRIAIRLPLERVASWDHRKIADRFADGPGAAVESSV